MSTPSPTAAGVTMTEAGAHQTVAFGAALESLASVGGGGCGSRRRPPAS